MPLIDVPGSQDGLVIHLEGLKPETIGAIPTTQKGQPGGVATLGSDRKVPVEQLPPLPPSPPPTLEELGAEPAGAEARAKSYTDEKIAQFPPPPTLTQLGGEPAGAEARAKSYTDGKISQLPPPPTLTQLGGEPAGAEARAKSYTDQQINLIKVTRSVSAPTNPADGDNWEQLDPNFATPLMRWRRISNEWRSEVFTQSKLYWVTTQSDDLVKERNWEIELWPKVPVAVSKIFLAYLKIYLTPYSAIQTAANHWKFTIFGMDANNNENYWNQLEFQENIAVLDRSEKILQINASLTLWSQLRRLRIQADAVGSPGLVLAYASVSHFYQIQQAAASNKVQLSIEGGLAAASLSARTNITVTISGLSGIDSVTRRWYQNNTSQGTASTWNLSNGAFTRTLTADQLMNYSPNNPANGTGSWSIEINDGTNTYRSNSISVVT
jgi:hypothetical protein